MMFHMTNLSQEYLRYEYCVGICMMSRVCLTLPEDLVKELKRKVSIEERTLSYTIRKMLEKQMGIE